MEERKEIDFENGEYEFFVEDSDIEECYVYGKEFCDFNSYYLIDDEDMRIEWKYF